MRRTRQGARNVARSAATADRRPSLIWPVHLASPISFVESARGTVFRSPLSETGPKSALGPAFSRGCRPSVFSGASIYTRRLDFAREPDSFATKA